MVEPEIAHPPVGTDEYDAWAAQDKGPIILATCWLFMALALVFTAARVLVRLKMYSKLRSDDYWCIAGTICGILATALTTVAVGFGNGRHLTLLTSSEKERVTLWTTAAFCPAVLCLGLPKLAVVRLLTRLMNPSRWHGYFLWFLAIWCLGTLGATVGTLLGQCQPTESLWRQDIEGRCVDPKIIVDFSLYAGTFSAFVDVYLAVYPAVVLFKLQLKLQKKIALVVALGIGCVSGAVAIFKTTRIPSGLASPDFSYDSSDLIIWTIIEGTTIIIACTIPVLSPLMEWIFHRNPFRTSVRRTTRDGYFKSNPSKRRDLDASAACRTYTSVHSQGVGDPTVDSDSLELVPRIRKRDGSTLSATGDVEAGDIGSMRNFSRPAKGIASMDKGIMRTDEVEVSYDSQSTLDTTRQGVPQGGALGV
ncbi:uncharacterized protein J7T54_000157 [Emericellopsis cladophorae]|uniref:Rhodopsin domain-containing protein n=1 Tax=Emericellopsis cladophorae TaxID=2686198 RepID=A0A9Q0BCN5_9HYPO|nr:uncharacterized protein J7T54_000157 [Emericellopsis cladophorae]KAI6780517.1 hypothetical protein J7T54_000157 [Emericellopsis cladophorae]